jgi:hypothetical protein
MPTSYSLNMIIASHCPIFSKWKSSFFFLEHARELHIIILSKRKRGQEPQYRELFTTAHPWHIKRPTHHYTTPPSNQPGKPRARRKDKSLTLAMVHNRALSLATWRVVATHGDAPWNTHWFLCFQMTQAPRITRELNPHLGWPCTRWLERCHHASKESSTVWGTNSWRPTTPNSPAQTCLAKTQETSKWLMVSSCWSHWGGGQRSKWSMPRLASLSEVEHMLCSTSPMKTLHLPGAQVFHTLSVGSKEMTPWKRAL